MFNALISDMDGLMINTEPLYWEVARELARRCGKSVSDATLRRMMGRSRQESMCIFAQECGIDASPEDLLVAREQLMIERFGRGVEPMPGLRQILERFYRRLRLAITTSSPRKFTDVLLPAMRVAEMFEVIQTGDEIPHGKPHPEIYLKTLSRLNVPAEQSVVLEDSHAGALSAKRAGCYVIAVPSPLTAEEDFSFADARVENLVDAAQHVEELLKRGWQRVGLSSVTRF